MWLLAVLALVTTLAHAQVGTVKGLELTIAGAAAKGQADAKFAIVEFADFECPFCGRYTRDTYGPLTKEFVDTGKVRYVFFHLPLERVHPRAFKAAEAAECAREQGKFWEMHDQLFANQQALAPADLLRHAQGAGVDTVQLQSCLDSGKMAARVRQDLAEAARLGAGTTPSFFIGRVQPDGTLKLLRKITGAQPYATFRAELQKALAARQ
jgi:protein-disulfide isomerase